MKLRLTNVIDVLHSDAGGPLVDALEARLAAAGAAVRSDVIGPHLKSSAPADAFAGPVARALFSVFALGRDVKAILPNAVTHVIARTADADGNIDTDAVGDRYGEAAKSLMLQIAELVNNSKGTTRRYSKYRFMPDELLNKLARSSGRGDLAGRMTVLADLARATTTSAAFAGFNFFAIQHLFATTGVLLETLAAAGVDRDRAFVLGKNYSFDPDAAYALRADGWNVPEVSFDRLMLEGADGAHEVSPVPGYLRSLFADVDPEAPDGRRFLILDDGGRVIDALHRDPELRRYAPLCVVVEQTERGLITAEALAADGFTLECPVVNVAQAWLKKQFESPMIGESIAHAITTDLEAMQLSVEPKIATVVGYGAVGKATADALKRRGYRVIAYDTDPRKHAAILADGCGYDAHRVATREEALARAHLYVSATGRSAIGQAEYGLLPNGAVLVNAASGNHELGLDALAETQGSVGDDPKAWVDDKAMGRTVFAGREIVLGDIAGDEQMRHRVVRAGDAERLVLRSGYVVNLVTDIPPELIQLTRALLFAGLVQATRETTPGLRAVDDDTQRFIHKRLERVLAKLGIDLHAPDFRKL